MLKALNATSGSAKVLVLLLCIGLGFRLQGLRLRAQVYCIQPVLLERVAVDLLMTIALTGSC